MVTKSKSKKEKTPKKGIKYRVHILKPVFWFLVGVFFATFCLVTLILVYFKLTYKNKIIPGVFIGAEYVGEKTKADVKKIFEEKNAEIGNSLITLSSDEYTATVSARDAKIGYDAELIAVQAASVGNSKDPISNAYYIINSYLNGTYLTPSYTKDLSKIHTMLEPAQKIIYIEPVDALFRMENNKVTAFKESADGKDIDFNLLEKKLETAAAEIIKESTPNKIIAIPIKILKPQVTTEKANNLGIVEPIGVGTSQFAHSIPNRVHNVALAASKINGVLVAPGDTFSFVKNIGDISKFTGYKEAYVIENGKTVLGDGGGVCQVSTTLFRAVLNAGLPIVERNAHAYRVGYYEQNSGPGIDATVYVPSVDFKFKNDTGNYLFIQEAIDINTMVLTFTIYGKSDGRTVSMTSPIITSQIPAPETQYQDDPTLPKGVEKQIDFAAAGANVVFSRTVKKDGKESVDTFKSNYRPWRAVFLRGTKEG